MSFNPESTLTAVYTHLRDLDEFVEIRIGQPPKAPLPAGFSARVSLLAMEVVETTLTAAIELHTVMVRIYHAVAAAPEDELEINRGRLIPLVMDSLKGDYTLGATLRAIDWGGVYGQRPRVDFDEEEVGGVDYWTAHLILPLIVDADDAAFAA